MNRRHFPFLRLYGEATTQEGAAKSQEFASPSCTLQVIRTGLACPLGVSFDSLGRRIESEPQIYFEWDGSFVWVSPNGRNDWQVDGMIYDAGDEVQYVEWKGYCDAPAWMHWLAFLEDASSNMSQNRGRLVAHWVDQDVWLDQEQIPQLFAACCTGNPD